MPKAVPRIPPCFCFAIFKCLTILKNAYIKQYDKASVFIPDERRTRKLLLNKAQIAKLEKKLTVSGTTIIPLKVYFKNNFANILATLELAKAKKSSNWFKTMMSFVGRKVVKYAASAATKSIRIRPSKTSMPASIATASTATVTTVTATAAPTVSTMTAA